MDSLLLRNPSHKDEQRNVQILDAKVLALDEQLGCVVRVRSERSVANRLLKHEHAVGR